MNSKNTSKLVYDSRGQGLTEYLILLVLIAVASIGVSKTLGKTIHEKVKTANKHINGGIKFGRVP